MGGSQGMLIRPTSQRAGPRRHRLGFAIIGRPDPRRGDAHVYYEGAIYR